MKTLTDKQKQKELQRIQYLIDNNLWLSNSELINLINKKHDLLQHN